ncbi:MAG: hypothetical protein ACE5FG_01560 [Myxococcota bacterium]
MLDPERAAFVQIPEASSKRVLHPARVVTVKRECVRLELEDSDLELVEETDVFLYSEVRRKFMQQPARLESVTREDSRLEIELVTTGDPISAESRQHYRVSALAAEIAADLGQETGLPVLDVSATGFSVYAEQRHAVGLSLPTCLHFEGESLSGIAVIQSLDARRPGRLRYGLRCLSEDGREELPAALPLINMAVQRQQARRLSGSR